MERLCEHCGTPLVRRRSHSGGQWLRKRFCDVYCVNAALRKPPHLCDCGCGQPTLPKRRWIKGHRPIKPMTSGYRRVWVGKDHPLGNADGNVLEHRLVLYNAGIIVRDGFHVHHKNEDKLDNRLENLEVLPESEHHRLHVRQAGFVVNQYGVWPLRETA